MAFMLFMLVNLCDWKSLKERERERERGNEGTWSERASPFDELVTKQRHTSTVARRPVRWVRSFVRLFIRSVIRCFLFFFLIKNKNSRNKDVIIYC